MYFSHDFLLLLTKYIYIRNAKVFWKLILFVMGGWAITLLILKFLNILLKIRHWWEPSHMASFFIFYREILSLKPHYPSKAHR